MRYFLAIEFDDVSQVLCDEIGAAGKVPSHHHLTLQFFGELEQADVQWIKNKLASFTFNAFSFTSQDFYSAFSSWERCRTIYVGVENKTLNTLASQLRSLFRERFVGKEFVAHITVARVSQQPNVNGVETITNIRFTPLTVRVSSISLLASTFDETGVSYTLVKKVKLN